MSWCICCNTDSQSSSKVYRSFLPAGESNELPNSPLDYLYKATSNKRTALSREAPLLVTPPVETPPMLATPSPRSERSAFSPPPERYVRGWRGIFGSSGSRTPNPSGGSRYQQQQIPQQIYVPPYDHQLHATNPRPYSPPPQYFPTEPAIRPYVPKSRPKARLVVGIDFGTADSAVAYALATNTEAKEDIITDWPGSGNRTLQRVCYSPQDV